MASPDAIDFFLGPDNQLVFGQDVRLVGGVEGVAQLCSIAVRMFAGELFSDLDRGIGYWDAILGVSPELARVAALSQFRDALSSVPGVLRIVLLTVEFLPEDAAARELDVKFQVSTASGDTPVVSLTISGLGA